MFIGQMAVQGLHTYVVSVLLTMRSRRGHGTRSDWAWSDCLGGLGGGGPALERTDPIRSGAQGAAAGLRLIISI